VLPAHEKYTTKKYLSIEYTIEKYFPVRMAEILSNGGEKNNEKRLIWPSIFVKVHLRFIIYWEKTKFYV
jgi:hypothetical protein